MTEDFIAPRPIRVFGDALRPVIGKLEERINGTPVPGDWQDDVFEFIANCLRRIEDDVETLADTVNSELNSVVAGEADDADIWRAVARLEVRIERLADGYDEVRGAECDIEDQGKFVLSQNPPPLRISCHFQVVKHPSHIHDEVTHGLSNPL